MCCTRASSPFPPREEEPRPLLRNQQISHRRPPLWEPELGYPAGAGVQHNQRGGVLALIVGAHPVLCQPCISPLLFGGGRVEDERRIFWHFWSFWSFWSFGSVGRWDDSLCHRERLPCHMLLRVPRQRGGEKRAAFGHIVAHPVGNAGQQRQRRPPPVVVAQQQRCVKPAGAEPQSSGEQQPVGVQQ